MSIKKLVLKLVVVSAIASVLVSCGGSKSQSPSSSTSGSTQPQQADVSGGGGNPFGEVYEVPCNVYDDDDWFAATGIASGPRTRMDVLQMTALTNAQNMIRRKMKHAYQGLVKDYSNLIGNNQGTDADIHIESGGDQIIDAIVNDSRATCGPKFSAPDAKGQVNAYLAIKISKREVANKLADKVEDMVSKDEELRIRFQESNFRDEMAKKFKEFKEEQSR
jgi:hypothetical protein